MSLSSVQYSRMVVFGQSIKLWEHVGVLYIFLCLLMSTGRLLMVIANMSVTCALFHVICNVDVSEISRVRRR